MCCTYVLNSLYTGITILYLIHTVESPAGVGFSYSTNPQVDYIINDNQTALDNYNFLVNFFANYSEYKANDFYVRYK